jgi:hypothetical protein
MIGDWIDNIYIFMITRLKKAKDRISVMVRRSRIRAILISPIGFSLFVVGWGLYAAGSNKNTKIIPDKPVIKGQSKLTYALLPHDTAKTLD